MSAAADDEALIEAAHDLTLAQFGCELLASTADPAVKVRRQEKVRDALAALRTLAASQAAK
jgi:hypothetical protein